MNLDKLIAKTPQEQILKGALKYIQLHPEAKEARGFALKVQEAIKNKKKPGAPELPSVKIKP